MTTLTTHLDAGSPELVKRIASQVSTWQWLTMVLIHRQHFERSTPLRPKGEIGRLIDDRVIRHDCIRIDGVNTFVLLPGARFKAVYEAMCEIMASCRDELMYEG
jgi:hypothetical protein